MAAGFRKVEGFELLRSSRGDQDGLSSSGIVQVEAFVQSAPSGYINVCVSHHLMVGHFPGSGRARDPTATRAGGRSAREGCLSALPASRDTPRTAGCCPLCVYDTLQVTRAVWHSVGGTLWALVCLTHQVVREAQAGENLPRVDLEVLRVQLVEPATEKPLFKTLPLFKTKPLFKKSHSLKYYRRICLSPPWFSEFCVCVCVCVSGGGV